MSNDALENSANAAFNKAVLHHYLTLPVPIGTIQATYVWFHERILGKTRTLDFIPTKVEELPIWDAGVIAPPEHATYAHIFLYPVAIFKDPFLRGNNILVLCAGYKDNRTPTEYNKRQKCVEIAEKTKEAKPWFGVEQEFTFLGMDMRPLGWPTNGFPNSQLRHCGVGADFVKGRDIVDAHYRACLYAGIKISGSNAEILLSQEAGLYRFYNMNSAFIPQ